VVADILSRTLDTKLHRDPIPLHPYNSLMEQLRSNLKRERDRIRSEAEVSGGGSGKGNGRKDSPSKSNSTKKSDEERIKEVVQKYMERTEVKGSKGVIPTLQYGAVSEQRNRLGP
jgi:hypothetical protein